MESGRKRLILCQIRATLKAQWVECSTNTAVINPHHDHSFINMYLAVELQMFTIQGNKRNSKYVVLINAAGLFKAKFMKIIHLW